MTDPIKGFPPLLPQIIRSVAAAVAKPVIEAVQQQQQRQAAQSSFEQATKPLVNLAGGAVNAIVDTLRNIVLNPWGRLHQGLSNTCGPNTLMAMEGSVDSARAAELRGTRGEERVGREVAVMNSGAGGFQAGGSISQGWGEIEMRNQVIDRFGAAELLPAGTDYPTDDANAQAVTDMTRILEEGRPVALGMQGHWLAATDIRDGESGPEALIHDSYTGTSAWVPVEDMQDTSSSWVQEHFPGAPEGDGIRTMVGAGEAGQPATLNPDSENRARETERLSTNDVSDIPRRSDSLAPAAQ